MSTKRRGSRIPEFASYEEEAMWWDEHDSADYQDELTTVDVRFVRPASLTSGLNVRFDPDTLRQLRERARSMGIGPTTLVRMWVLERLRAEGGKAPTGSG